MFLLPPECFKWCDSLLLLLIAIPLLVGVDIWLSVLSLMHSFHCWIRFACIQSVVDGRLRLPILVAMSSDLGAFLPGSWWSVWRRLSCHLGGVEVWVPGVWHPLPSPRSVQLWSVATALQPPAVRVCFFLEPKSSRVSLRRRSLVRVSTMTVGLFKMQFAGIENRQLPVDLSDTRVSLK